MSGSRFVPFFLGVASLIASGLICFAFISSWRFALCAILIIFGSIAIKTAISGEAFKPQDRMGLATMAEKSKKDAPAEP